MIRRSNTKLIPGVKPYFNLELGIRGVLSLGHYFYQVVVPLNKVTLQNLLYIKVLRKKTKAKPNYMLFLKLGYTRYNA
jgi:hypothetical protein